MAISCAKWAGLGVLGLLAAAIAVPASAQLPGATLLEEVVVTAQRREQNLSDVGMTVASYGGEFLANRNIVAADRLGEVVAGLTVAVNPDGTPVYTLRGVGFNSTNLGAQPTVSVYLDEAPLPYGPMTQGPLFDLERLEVLRGPQGTLYGQNSTGGAINYISAKPTEDLTAKVRVGFSRFSTFEGEGFLSGSLAENLNARLAVFALNGDEWQENYLRDGSIGKQEKFAARLLFDWRPTESVSVAVNLNSWSDKSDNQMGAFLLALPRVPANAIPGLATLPPANGAREADWDPNTEFDRDNQQWQAVARLDLDLTENLTFTSLSNYVTVDVDSRFDNDATVFKLGDALTIGDVEVFSQELRLSGTNRDGKSNFVVGVYYQDDTINEGQSQIFEGTSSTQNISSPPLPPPGLGTIRESENRGVQTNTALGLFGNIEWELTDRLSAIGGIRFTTVTHKNQSCTADTGNGDWANVVNGLLGLFGVTSDVQPGECVTIREDFSTTAPQEEFDEDNVSWRAGLNYKAAQDTLLYGLISRGYKAGNFPIINAIAGSSLRPVTEEELTSYEIGIKTVLAKNVRLDTALYFYEYKDKQLLTNTLDPIFGPVPTLGNVPDSEAYGVDVDITWKPTDGFTLRGAVGYQDTTLGRFTDYDVYSNTVELKGKSFNFAPDLTLMVDGEYRFAITAGLEAFAGASVSHNSETYADLAQSSELRIESYTLIGLSAGVGAKDGTWDVQLWGRNVTDETYWTHAILGYDGLYRIMGRPATYGVTVTYRPGVR